MALRDRIALLRSSDQLTLGTVLDRLRPIHGPRRLVEESGDGLTLTFAAGADAVPRAWFRQEAVTGMPVAHVVGFTVLLQMAALGVPVYLLTKFRPDEAIEAIETRRATMFVGVPAMYRMMLEAGAEDHYL